VDWIQDPEKNMQESRKQNYSEPTLEKREELVLVTEGVTATTGTSQMTTPN
jgi:hypothetical protein